MFAYFYLFLYNMIYISLMLIYKKAYFRTPFFDIFCITREHIFVDMFSSLLSYAHFSEGSLLGGLLRLYLLDNPPRRDGTISQR